jgi:hypothetical protein
MDDIAHILWSIVIYYHHSWFLAGLFGILPDIIVFVPFYTAKILSGKIRSFEQAKPKSDMQFYTKWVTPLYTITHSLLFVGLFVGACSLAFGYRLEYWAMLIHVLVDIPSHQRQWFGTKLFWPFHNWQFNGGNWATRDFMLANYTGIALAYCIRIFGL